MKRCSFAVRTLLAGASLLVTGLGAAPVAQAALQFDGSPGNGTPPATLGGYTMVPSPQDTREDGTSVGDAPATTTSSFSFDISPELLTIPDSWQTTGWEGGSYSGRVYYTNNASSMTITLPSPSGAVYFYAAPNQQATLDMRATAKSVSGATVTSGEVPVTSAMAGGSQPSGQFFGFYGTNGDTIKSVTVALDDPSADFSDFAVGDFGLSNGQVAVVDNDLSLSSIPSDMTVDATGPAGAAVRYTAPAAVDPDDPGSATVTCSPSSGSTFAIGSTPVTCAASDDNDTNSPATQSFMVTVVGAAGQLSDLATAVNGVTPGTSLPGKVAAAQSALASDNSGGACQALDSFVSEAGAQTGKHVPAALAGTLVGAAQQIEAVLSCVADSTRHANRGH